MTVTTSYRPIPLPDYREITVEAMRANAEAFHAEMRARHTVRDFSSRPVPRDIIETCILTAGTAPNGANHQPWHFAVIGDPAIKKRIREKNAGHPETDTSTQCFPHGMPRLMESPYPIEIVQTPGRVTFLHEVAHEVRRIYLDQQHPKNLKESFLGASDDVIGRTTNVTGTAAVAGSQLSTATFQINLDSIVVSGKTSQPQLVQSLNTAKYPAATITLTQPVTLPAEFISGTTIDQTVPATLSLNGTTKPVTVTLTARRDGSKIEAAGSLPVAFSDFSIQGPKGYGFFGSLSTNGSAEFVLVLAPATAG